MHVSISNTQTHLNIHNSQIEQLAQAVVSHEGLSYDEVALHFITNEEMCRLHAEHFDDPSPTDCISFPMDEPGDGPYTLLGDVFVCPETAIGYAAIHDKNPYEELTLYVVHGLLHLMGYDDIADQDRKEMRAAEKKHLNHLKKMNLMLHDGE